MNIMDKINVSFIKSKTLWTVVISIIIVGSLFYYGLNQINNKKTQYTTGAAFSTTTNLYTYTDGNITFTIPKGWKQSSRSKGYVVEAFSADKMGLLLITNSHLTMTVEEKIDPSSFLISEFQKSLGTNNTFLKTEIAGKPSVSYYSSLWGKDSLNINAVISNDSMYVFLFDASTTAAVSQLQPTFDTILKSVSFK